MHNLGSDIKILYKSKAIYSKYIAYLWRWANNSTRIVLVVYCWTRIHRNERIIFTNPIDPGKIQIFGYCIDVTESVR